MKSTLTRLIQHEQLSKEDAREVLIDIATKEYDQASLASFLTVFMMRKISLEELKGFKEALQELCIRVNIDEYNAMDVCGTGGDGKNTFNISTLAAFVTASTGVNIAKHGNYGVSSVSGSSNVLESLGIQFRREEGYHKKCLDEAGICILHAPLFHPAMKAVGPVRKSLGLKTFFNMLGPLVNPSFPKTQMVGVFNLELLRMYAYIFQQEQKKYSIVHDLEGYDEISLTGKTKVFQQENEMLLGATDFKVPTLKNDEIFGGDTVEEAASIFMQVLSGKGTEAQTNVVAANAGLAIATASEKSIEDAFLLAKDNLRNGKALITFNKLKSIT
jgi:anthranilate phosphoribosyltransferase